MNNDDFVLSIHFYNNLNIKLDGISITEVETGQKRRLAEATFLVRFKQSQGSTTTRCLIRHVESGQEIFVQSGTDLVEFIKAYLLYIEPN